MGARMDRRSRRLCGAGNSNGDDGTYSWDLMGFGKSIDSGEARPGRWNSQSIAKVDDIRIAGDDESEAEGNYDAVYKITQEVPVDVAKENGKQSICKNHLRSYFAMGCYLLINSGVITLLKLK